MTDRNAPYLYGDWFKEPPRTSKTAEQIARDADRWANALAPTVERMQKHMIDALLYGTSVMHVGIDESHHFKGLASRYWPAANKKDHPHMNDLTISAAPKGGFTVLDYDDNVVFAGAIAECCDHVAEHFKKLEADRLRDEAEKEATVQREQKAMRIRTEAEAAVQALRTQPAPGRLS